MGERRRKGEKLLTGRKAEWIKTHLGDRREEIERKKWKYTRFVRAKKIIYKQRRKRAPQKEEEKRLTDLRGK